MTPPSGVGMRGLWTINVDGTNAVKLVSGWAFNPDWSPDGGKIAYDLSGNIYVINADGSDPTQITAGVRPDWSPDGTKLVYQSSYNNGNIYISDTDGSNTIQLTTDGASGMPDWSP